MFDDRNITNVAMGRRGVGFVFQDYAIFTHMNVRENLAFGLRMRRPCRAARSIAASSPWPIFSALTCSNIRVADRCAKREHTSTYRHRAFCHCRAGDFPARRAPQQR